ncbi:MAG TPA: protein kinase [Kofleriaceae bacterium]|nr:protein kinase [Kofleriaceae bacterium]
MIQKLGEGGMGSVYLAEHPQIGKKVALKVLHAEFSSNADVTQRFFHEAKAVNDIGHPNIVDIVDYGRIQQPGSQELVYFIMEYLHGQSLSQVIRNDAPLPPERALGIALQVADALAASHKCGIVHRDLKPDNIMLLSRGRERDFVKLLDFGIAKLENAAAGSHRTRTGIVMGTPAYMSPEQCEGRGRIDHRTDVYALGIVLYEMLVGRVPFIGEGYGEILVQHLTQPAIPPSQFRMINPHVEAVVMKALEKRPENRFPTMDEMMRAMSDPIGYVEAHGGIAGFSQRQLTPSNAPLPPPTRPTPSPFSTPIPGTLTPTPGHGFAAPTISGGGPLTSPTPIPVPTAGGRSKLGLVIAALVVLAAAAVGIVLVLNSGGKKTEPVAGSDDTASGSAAVASGSASDPGSGSGSAKTVDRGSGSALAAGSGSDAAGSNAAGSNAAVGSGSAAVAEPKVSTITLTTTPPGAKIYVNGQEIDEVTPQPFEVKLSKKPIKITLRLDKYEDIVLDAVPDKNVTVEKTFKPKKRVTTTTGKGSNATTGKGSASPNTGKGSGSGKGNDTGLERPGD